MKPLKFPSNSPQIPLSPLISPQEFHSHDLLKHIRIKICKLTIINPWIYGCYKGLVNDKS